MKISNSKKQLAKIISENGGWCGGHACAWFGKKTNSGYFAATRPQFNKNNGTMDVWGPVEKFACPLIKNWHQTILSRDEYFHLYPAPDADGWIEWLREELPVPKGTIIDVRYSDGDELYGAPCGIDVDMASREGRLACAHVFGPGAIIIAYRLHKPDAGVKVAVENQTTCHLTVTDKPTIEQLAADYRNAKDYADRKQQEADAAKADADAKLSELVAAGKTIGLSIAPITAKQEPELVITDVGDLLVGDEVRCVNPNGGLVEAGSVGVVVDVHSGRFFTDFPEQRRYVYLSSHLKRGDVVFIRRPVQGADNA